MLSGMLKILADCEQEIWSGQNVIHDVLNIVLNYKYGMDIDKFRTACSNIPASSMHSADCELSKCVVKVILKSFS